jgi:adenylate cyclase
MQQTIAALAPDFSSRGWPVLRAGIGLNSGTMNVGNMGSTFRVAYTVMGDAVNIASRLEGLTRQYGVDIIVGEDTRKPLADWVFCELDQVRVKGRDGPLVIYEPIGLRAEVTPAQFDAIARFELMLHHYRRQDWAHATALLDGLLQQAPARKCYTLYRERIEFFMQHPPDSQWDGVFTFKTK